MAPNVNDSLLTEKPEAIVPCQKQRSTKEEISKSKKQKPTCFWKKIVCELGDAVFSSVLVAPLVVGVWRGTWGLMDRHGEVFPYTQSFLLGITIHVSFALVRSSLAERARGAWSAGAGRWLRERALSRVYTYVFTLACIMHWRGGWGLFDAAVVAALPHDQDPHRPVLIAVFLLIVLISIMWLRSARNILATPYFLVTDGKEPTYLFTTRFKKTASIMAGGGRGFGGRAGVRGGAAIPPREADMRGSTAGLADTLSGGALLAAGDALFAALLVAPAVVAYWQSTWALLDRYVLPGRAVASAAACAALGLALELAACLGQGAAAARLSPSSGRARYLICSRLYTWLAGVACVAAWRGVWNLLNECTGDSARTLLSTTAAATLSLAALRALRNICAAPFAIALDTHQDYFDVPTMFRTSSRDTALYVLDCIFSVAVVGSLVVFVWRGSWALLDIYLYPDDPARSLWTSLGCGYAVAALTFALQTPLRWAASRLRGAARLLLADCYHLLSFVATVNVWRGVWGLLDLYLMPDNPKLSNWCTHIFSLAILMLLNCSNTILVRGVYIDAEEPAGECVVFPCHYIRLYFHKEQTKKRHRRALAAAEAAALARSEDASLAPLHLPPIEEKV